jgi:uncharacterized protein YbjT (DUF2867 family)
MNVQIGNATRRPILVTGGTGTLGSHVVARLRAAGQDVRVLSRGNRHAAGATGEPATEHTTSELGTREPGIEHVAGDLATGAGIEAAVAGIEVIVHCAGTRVGDDEKARNLVRAASEAGVRHLVYISVVGADRIPIAGRMDRAMFGYFESKLAGERVVAESGIPWSTLRATQFHDLTFLTVRQMARLPIIPVPAGFRFQPVDSDEVAARLVDLALGAPAGLVPDIAGPKAYAMADLVRSYLRTTGKHRLLVPAPMPGKAARAVRTGANLSPDRAVGRRTWEDFLAEHAGSRHERRLAAT